MAQPFCGQFKTTLRANKTGRAEFTYKDGYAVPVKFELAPI